jgi:hypothetical protein
MESPLKYFADVLDPRVNLTREHLLEEILLLTIAAVLSGPAGGTRSRTMGGPSSTGSRASKVAGSIPSHDTFNRVFSGLDPEELEKGFVAWMASIAKLTGGEVVSIDGEALRLLKKLKSRQISLS